MILREQLLSWQTQTELVSQGPPFIWMATVWYFSSPAAAKMLGRSFPWQTQLFAMGPTSSTPGNELILEAIMLCYGTHWHIRVCWGSIKVLIVLTARIELHGALFLLPKSLNVYTYFNKVIKMADVQYNMRLGLYFIVYLDVFFYYQEASLCWHFHLLMVCLKILYWTATCAFIILILKH